MQILLNCSSLPAVSSRALSVHGILLLRWMALWETTRSLRQPPPYHFSTLLHPALSNTISHLGHVAMETSTGGGVVTWRRVPELAVDALDPQGPPSLSSLLFSIPTLDAATGSQHIANGKHCGTRVTEWLTVSTPSKPALWSMKPYGGVKLTINLHPIQPTFLIVYTLWYCAMGLLSCL